MWHTKKYVSGLFIQLGIRWWLPTKVLPAYFSAVLSVLEEKVRDESEKSRYLNAKGNDQRRITQRIRTMARWYGSA